MNLRTAHPTAFARLNFKPARRGFTLVELMVAIGLAALIMLMTLMIMRGANQARAVTQARLNAGEAARVFFGTFERDFGAAIPGPFCEFGQPPGTPGPWQKKDFVVTYGGAYLGDTIGFPTSLTDYSESQVASNLGFQRYLLITGGGTTPLSVSTVRYYITQDGTTPSGPLCREVSLAQALDTPPDSAYPFVVSPPPMDTNLMLLPNIADLRVSYLYWKPDDGQYYYYDYSNPLDPKWRANGHADISVADPHLATHLNVALTTYDPTPGLPVPRRSFQKIVPIPAGFQ